MPGSECGLFISLWTFAVSCVVYFHRQLTVTFYCMSSSSVLLHMQALQHGGQWPLLPYFSLRILGVTLAVVPLQNFSTHLKTLDTIGSCQRSVFSLGVSQHMHKITNL